MFACEKSAMIDVFVRPGGSLTFPRKVVDTNTLMATAAG
jgi:hypothetical protein